MAKMIAFGDSFTWGSDMGDTMRDFEWAQQSLEWQRQPQNRFDNLYSRRTWQAKYAEHLGYDYKCYAEQGCSNQSIVRQFFKYAPSFKQGDLISVNFTWRNRYDLFDSLTNKWETIRPSGTEESRFFELYYKNIQSDFWDQVESLKAINLVLNYLKLHKIDFIATCIDRDIYNKKFIADPTVETLFNDNADQMLWFDDLGFYEWSKVNNFPISPMWHPLEDAHEAAFNYVVKNYVVS